MRAARWGVVHSSMKMLGRGARVLLVNMPFASYRQPSLALGLPDGIGGPFNRAAEMVLDRLRRTLDAPEPSGHNRKVYSP